MRIAHIIMVHKNPAQLLRLVKRMAHPDFDIYIHLDKKIDISEFKFIADLPQVTFIKDRIICNWGGWSFTRAIVQSLKEVITTGLHYDFINLISGQDYPIYSATEVHKYFSDKIGHNFIHVEHNESDWKNAALKRFEKFHFTDSNLRGKYILQKFVNFITKKRTLPDNMEFYGGSKSSWWIISYDCAVYLYQKLDMNKKFHNFFKYSWGSDEFVIATVIMNSEFKNKTARDNLRYIDWSAGEANPKFLKIEDLKRIIDSKMIFARKFDLNIDSEILDKLDENTSVLLT